MTTTALLVLQVFSNFIEIEAFRLGVPVSRGHQAVENKGLAEREGFEPSVPVLASTTV
jgi:hypothetical protein